MQQKLKIDESKTTDLQCVIFSDLVSCIRAVVGRFVVLIINLSPYQCVHISSFQRGYCERFFGMTKCYCWYTFLLILARIEKWTVRGWSGCAKARGTKMF